MPVRAKVSLKTIDLGLRQIRNTARALRGSKGYVKAGVLGNGKKRPGEVTNADLAVWAEYGTSRAPARPFILPSFMQHRPEYLAMLARLMVKVYRGKLTYENALELIGLKMAADMKFFVTGGAPIAPPNAPATIDRKLKNSVFGRLRIGPPVSPRTLVDTGAMVGSITHQVIP